MSNITIITGNLAADPILRSLENGTSICAARLIHSESYFDKEADIWKDGNLVSIDLEIWGKSAEAFAAHSQKGSELFCEAQLIANNYEKEDGTKVYGYRLRVSSWKVISKGKKTGGTPTTKKTAKKAAKNG